MSRIDKLSISGVRSFSPSVREAIQFNTPLTLIVGYNGSGKTTIIECLKYATTGELPPNSKGGAFIHDPKLCGEKEVMAQVKLQFRSINDRQHVATRSLQLTVKKTTRSQKTLDCSLVVVNNGERTTTSTRQAQLDEMIPERLGVSPAILDAVIFCHQDESLWPLSEPAALKKRFDEIFEALKYTKAIDNLKVLRKKHVEQLGKLQNDEAHNKANKDRGERAEKRMTGLQAEIEDAREKCEALSAEMQETHDKIRRKYEQANSFLQIVQNVGNKKEQLEYRQDAVNELKQTFDELHEDDASLETALAQYENSMERYREEAEQSKSQYNDLQQELADSRKNLSTKLSEQGKHQSDKDKYERQVKARMEMLQEAAVTHGFRGYDRDLTEHHVKSFNEKIQKLLAEKKRDLERLQKENAAELDKATGVITELEGRKAARTQDRVSAKQRIGAIEKRTSVLQNEASLIDVDEGAKAILDGQLEDICARFSRAQAQMEQANWDQHISDENDKLWQLETENEKLGRELVECTRLASERAQLDYRKKEVADRKRKLETLTNTWKSKLATAIGSDWELDTLETKFHTVLTQQNKALQDARRSLEQAKQKQQKVEYRLKNARESQESKSRDAETCKKQVLTALHKVRDGAVIDDYQEEVGSVEQQVEDYRNELSLFDALVDYYSKCKRMLESKKRCLLCERHFDDGQSASLDRLSKKIEKNLDPKGKVDVEKDLKEAMASLDSLRSVRSSYDTYKRLTAELPSIRDECKAIESEYDALERQLEEHESRVAGEDGRVRDLDDLSKTVSSVSQLMKDIQDSESQVDRIMSQQLSGGTTRSADEIHELQASIGEQMRGLKNRVAKLTTDRQRMKDQLGSLELERSELRNKIGQAVGQLDKKNDIQNQIQALRDDMIHQRETIQRADEELEKVEPSIVDARSARDDTLRRGRAKEQVIVDERDVIANSVSEMKLLDNDIQDYIDRGGPSNLASNQRAIAALEKSISNTEKDIADLTVRANKLKQDIDSGDRMKKNISDNLNYRKHLRQLEVLRREIEELEDRNAHEDYERLQSEARSLENQSNRLLAERGSVMGSMKTKDEELGRLLQEWEMDYKGAKQKYRESHIRVETTKAAIEDLAQCGAAVDKAVMQFHSMKMAEVNRIAGELWQSTYQGTDIDTILIRSDNESTSGKRNYNYRLCMVKQDTEMDMRGRCSAGQKVLASIIIRLALAESFGVNCGLIALDEPTTNLDRDNIKSLAESLHMIIKTRQAQSNFQLIVITHDEDFLRHMRCSDFCDSFFRVKRDATQNSVIVRESITKIF
ncbi:DNA repair protein rad50 [Metarhizium acridum]|uniref:DNA repair protein RAD50 n=1 Tax=Metarhizium acridum (strain CQMa 102) TaxID=655827 RepID=E9EI45_METAQ|nr:DNA repaire protein UVS6 [Metarhizium acridum CQMa 102]EFY84416.1 DNA repaire protein UVS6 [Metarhizium acridum CQMa 102]KAG8415644.1 DNA repair protein rad50 [Metarhizium acridum]